MGEIHSKDSVTHNNAEPVFLLFKQALATGWDCPRAKVLVKLRENMSETFEIQLLGACAECQMQNIMEEIFLTVLIFIPLMKTTKMKSLVII